MLDRPKPLVFLILDGSGYPHKQTDNAIPMAFCNQSQNDYPAPFGNPVELDSRDSAVPMNFRADQLREISQASSPSFDAFDYDIPSPSVDLKNGIGGVRAN